MAAYESLRKQSLELYQQLKQLVALCLGPRVLRTALRIETTLVAHADGTAVVGTAVGTHLKQVAVLGHLAVAPDVEVVADGAELTCLVVAHHLFHRVVAVFACGGAVENDPPHRLHTVHHQSRLNLCGEDALAGHLVAGKRHWIQVVNHISPFAHEVMVIALMIEMISVPTAFST